MSTRRPKALTYRVENIPPGTSKESLIKDYFNREDQNFLQKPAPDGPRLHDGSISIDKYFRGFTRLYVPPKEKGPIVADIIAVTGLAGHAFGSWAMGEQKMWLRDDIPRDAPSARIMSYGYLSNLQDGTTCNSIQDHSLKFLRGLIDLREECQCESRPIIYIGHSIGCLIIKKALMDAINVIETKSRLPVRCIIFLAAPHRGLNIAALQTLVKGEPPEVLINELDPNSTTLAALNEPFSQFTENINILTFYENKLTKTVIEVEKGVWKREGPPAMMVAAHSAQLFTKTERRVAADSDHSQIAKVRKGQEGIYMHIKSAIKHGLLSTAGLVAGAEDTTIRDLSLNAKNRDPFTYPGSPHSTLSNDSDDTAVDSHLSLPRDRSCSCSEYCPSPAMSRDTATFETTSSIQHAINTNDGHSPGHDGKPVEKINWNNKELDDMIVAFNEFILDKADAAADHVYGACCSCGKELKASGYHFACPKECEKSRYICSRCQAKIATCIECWQASSGKGSSQFQQRVEYATGHSFTYTDIPPAIMEEDYILVRCLKNRDTPGTTEHARNRKLLDAHGYLGYTPLHIAAFFGYEEGVNLLLDRGALLNSRQYENLTPLVIAIQMNQTGIVKLLIDYGADVKSLVGQPEQAPTLTALHFAATLGFWHMIAILLKHKDSMEMLNATSVGGTPLQLAGYSKSLACTKILLEAGANPNTTYPEDKIPPLAQAVLYNDPDIVRCLLTFKPRIHTSTVSHAILEDRLEIFEMLVKQCGNVDQRDSSGRTPLIYAAECGRGGMCEILLDLGAEVDEEISEGKLRMGFNALAVAAAFGHLDVVELLIKRDANCFPPYVFKNKWKNLNSHFHESVSKANRKKFMLKIRKFKYESWS